MFDKPHHVLQPVVQPHLGALEACKVLPRIRHGRLLACMRRAAVGGDWWGCCKQAWGELLRLNSSYSPPSRRNQGAAHLAR